MNNLDLLYRRAARLTRAIDLLWYQGLHATPRMRALEMASIRLWSEIDKVRYAQWRAEQERLWAAGLPAHP